MTRGSVLVGALVLASCGGDRYVFDLADRPDGIKLILLLDEALGFIEALGPLEVENGQRKRGDPIDRPLVDGVRARLLELPSTVLDHPLGPTIFETLTAVADDRPARPALAGSRLRVLEPVPADAPVLAPTSSGLELQPAVEASTILERIELQREIETEPCAPPFNALQPFSATEGGVFDGLEEPAARASAVHGLHQPSPDLTIVLGTSAMALVRARVLPVATRPRPPMPRDWLTRADFGASPLRMMLPISGDRYVVVGGPRNAGRSWVVERSVDGLRVTDTATAPARLEGIVEVDGRFLAIDIYGAVYETRAPQGPWVPLAPPVLDEAEDVLLAVSEGGRVARSVDSVVDFLEGSRWPPVVLDAPSERRSGIESLLWIGEERLLAGTEQGDIFVLSEGPRSRLGDSLPPRFASCASLRPQLDDVRLDAEIVSLLRFRGTTLAVFDQCSAIWSFRDGDGCPGLVLGPTEGPQIPSQAWRWGGIEGDRLYVGGEQGLLLVSTASDVVR